MHATRAGIAGAKCVTARYVKVRVAIAVIGAAANAHFCNLCGVCADGPTEEVGCCGGGGDGCGARVAGEVGSGVEDAGSYK